MNKLFPLLACLIVPFWSNNIAAQTIEWSDDNSYKGTMAGEDIVFVFQFDEGQSYSTFFLEKDGKSSFLDGYQKGDSLFLSVKNDPVFSGEFRLRLVSNNTSAIGVWRHEGKSNELTVHKTNAKDWATQVDRSKANKIVSIMPHFFFNQSNIIKLNQLRFQKHKSDQGMEWEVEPRSGVVFPRSKNKELNEKLEGLHYNFALQVLNTNRSKDIVSIDYQTTVLLHTDKLLSLKTEIVTKKSSGKSRHQVLTYLFDKKNGQLYQLKDLVQISGTAANDPDASTSHLIELLLQEHFATLVAEDKCTYGALAGSGFFTWVLGKNQLYIVPTSNKEICYKEFEIPYSALRFTELLQPLIVNEK